MVGGVEVVGKGAFPAPTPLTPILPSSPPYSPLRVLEIQQEYENKEKVREDHFHQINTSQVPQSIEGRDKVQLSYDHLCNKTDPI